MSRATLIGTRLRERRLQAGLRQGDVSRAAGISPSYLNLIEHNRRNVTPDVLERLAGALGLPPGDFTEAEPGALVADLRAAAAGFPGSGAETDRAAELAGRYPGWAQLIADLQAHIAGLRQGMAALNDRLGHDPHLSAALHELLSALSAVRATAGILVETEDLTPDWQRRFHQNLHHDSERLVGGAEALISWLDHSGDEAESAAVTPQDELETWAAALNWSLPEDEEVALARLKSAGAKDLARAWIAAMRADLAAMPEAEFSTAWAESGDPALLAARFGVPVQAVMRRVALRPDVAAGLVRCDASGTLLFRKPVAGFALPRYGAACPLWPLFTALMRSGQPVTARVAMPQPGGGRFLCLAFCEARLPWGFGGPELREATMLILPDDTRRVTPDLAASGMTPPDLAAGSTCRLCPREACPARREPSILSEPAQQGALAPSVGSGRRQITF
ncbi:helix-turn-helix domain-containing protein [Xinfangfangia sp. D13-10-4-6]|uniref:helix-turn-helix transcriptional regulator n=1 Tax=Pseudogemmobacter hezensis TaxID=2737662 RepID=UPI001556EB4C|nr:helix-turn-helix transcriptional regulator [Pseudogemmobacter hezensis]NPD15817.1 helix-turn-helix domain-containing protein [Pseudogemmobacter hezensis]